MYVANKQRNNSAVLDLKAKNEQNRYGRVIYFIGHCHMFISLIPMGIFASMIPEDTEYRNAYYVAHKTIGVTVFLLVLVRLVGIEYLNVLP